MEKFREFVTTLAENCPNAPSTPAHKTLFQDRLNQWLSEYKTPDHPPYSAMIERALNELSEKNGSTEDEISQFIIEEYDALPWAHLTLLEHYLETLCKSGDIVLNRGKRYMLAVENTFLTSSTKVKKKKRKRKSRCTWESNRNKQRKKRNHPKDSRVDRIKEPEESDEKLTEYDATDENNQNKGMMAVNDMEHSRHMPQFFEINPLEIMNGHIRGAGKEQKLEEERTNDDQLAVSSTERPPGFESIIVENLSDSGIFFRTCHSSLEQDISVGARELLGLPVDEKNLVLAREPTANESSKYMNLLELTELTEVKRSSEAIEMAVLVQEGNPKSVEVHEMVSNTSLASYGRCEISKLPEEGAIPNAHVPGWGSGILSASTDEICTSKRMERQWRRWSRGSPKAVNFTGLDTIPDFDHQLPLLKLSDVEMPQEQREESVSSPNPGQDLLHEKPQCELLEAQVLEVAKSVRIESEPKEIKVYSRRTKTRPEESQSTIQVGIMNSDVNLVEPNTIVDSQNSSLNEHETRVLLPQPPLVHGEALEDKPSHAEDARLMDLLQPSIKQKNVRTVPKRRGRPPKHKPVLGMCKVLSPSLCQEMNMQTSSTRRPSKRQT